MPVRFEEFSAQGEPSREVCLREVAQSDVYLLLLGPEYGATFPETRQSATHEEWTLATQTGLHRIVYRKQGVQFKDQQQEFARTIEAYATGVFRDHFQSTDELLEKVVPKLQEIAAGPDPLQYETLEREVEFRWRDTTPPGVQRIDGRGPILEVHVIPIDRAAMSTRQSTAVFDTLPGRFRRSARIDEAAGLQTDREAGYCTAEIRQVRPNRFGEPNPAEIVGMRACKSGQVSIWASLPQNGMAGVLDPDGLPTLEVARIGHSLAAVECLGARAGTGLPIMKLSTLRDRLEAACPPCHHG
ncbi:DUF4062 domain-containing protein [Pseudonocardia sp. ICBG1293]|uniref:DUF4062 domain-containing protein n=1 Tax=Pseudonocardia sp. ICBG1293 TaxID=2844382 RepID=UPI001CCB7A3D